MNFGDNSGMFKVQIKNLIFKVFLTFKGKFSRPRNMYQNFMQNIALRVKLESQKSNVPFFFCVYGLHYLDIAMCSFYFGTDYRKPIC